MGDEKTSKPNDSGVDEIKIDEAEIIGSDAKSEAKTASKKCGCNTNLWIIATVIIGILLVVSVYFNVAKPSGMPTGAVTLDAASKKTLETINTKLLQPGTTAKLVNSSSESGMYKMTFDINGNNIESYVSTDGKYLFTSAIDLDNIPSAEEPVTETPVKADKPVVELFVMSHCPYGTQAEKGMIPAIEALGDKVDFQLRFVYYAMHGEKEVKEQLNQYCIQKEQKDRLLPYLKCFLDKGDGAACLTTAGIDTTKLGACTAAADKEFNVTANLNNKDSWLSGQFPKFDIDAALNTKYAVGGSPTLVLNGKESSAGRSPKSYFDAICASFNTAPEACKTANVSSTAYGAGFGYTQTASDAAAAAQCG